MGLSLVPILVILTGYVSTHEFSAHASRSLSQSIFKVIFTVQHYASMVYAVVICLSVYPLGQTSILSKRLDG